MDDIVDQLKSSYRSDLFYNLFDKAANEIVKLRDRIQHLESENARLERLSNG